VKWLRRTPLASVRWAVIDCETSGLDPRRDRLLSVGAVEVSNGRMLLENAYASLVRQEKGSDRENILIHGIGADAQLGASPADEALRGLARFLGEAIPVAFHAPFDEEVLRRAFAAHKMRVLRKAWLDLAQLAPSLFPKGRRPDATLDHWLDYFAIAPLARHDALGDAFAEAQLLLVLLAEASRKGVATLEQLLALTHVKPLP
jgi:DNA polymerase III subunit epsilon